MDLIVLKNEIDNDPIGLGYKDGAKYKNNKDISFIMNTVPSLPSDGRQVANTNTRIDEILACIVPTEWDGMQPNDREKLSHLLMAEKLDLSKSNILGFFDSIFGAGTTTRSNIHSLANLPASRSVVLFGHDVYYWDVAKALNNGNPDCLTAVSAMEEIKNGK
jgi:hypothetical protein